MRDLLLHTARLLNLKNVEAELLLIEVTEFSEELNKLIRCLNAAVSEIVEEYCPLKTIERFAVANASIAYKDFSKTPQKILWVRDTFGYTIRYSPRSGGISLQAQNVDVCYTYLLLELAVDDELPISCISMRTIAYGIISEFYILSNRYEEGAMYSKRFKGSLRNITSDFSEKTMPTRRLI